MSKLKVVLQEQLKLCRVAQLLRDIKAFVVFFNDTLGHYGLDVAPLVGVVHEMRSFYVELAQRDSSDEFDHLLANESGAPLTLCSSEDFSTLGSRHALVPRHAELPLAVEFSAFVPRALDALLAGVGDVREFSADLPGAAALVWRAADRLLATLARRVCEHATNAPSARSIAARVQLLCDVHFIASALPALELRIARFADVAAGSFDRDALASVASAPLSDTEYEIALECAEECGESICNASRSGSVSAGTKSGSLRGNSTMSLSLDNELYTEDGTELGEVMFGKSIGTATNLSTLGSLNAPTSLRRGRGAIALGETTSQIENVSHFFSF